MGRLLDAWLTLIGRSDPQIRAEARLVRIEAEWYGICRHLVHVLEDLNLADDKLRKREERAAKRATAATPAAPAATHAALPLSSKEAMRARLRAEGKLGVPPSRVRGGNGHTDEPGAENA